MPAVPLSRAAPEKYVSPAARSKPGIPDAPKPDLAEPWESSLLPLRSDSIRPFALYTALSRELPRRCGKSLTPSVSAAPSAARMLSGNAPRRSAARLIPKIFATLASAVSFIFISFLFDFCRRIYSITHRARRMSKRKGRLLTVFPRYAPRLSHKNISRAYPAARRGEMMPDVAIARPKIRGRGRTAGRNGGGKLLKKFFPHAPFQNFKIRAKACR